MTDMTEHLLNIHCINVIVPIFYHIRRTVTKEGNCCAYFKFQEDKKYAGILDLESNTNDHNKHDSSTYFIISSTYRILIKFNSWNLWVDLTYCKLSQIV